MEDRISAVQQSLLVLLVASLALALLARPHPENRRYTSALNELTTFQAGFDRNATEALLRSQAEAQGLIPLAAVRAQAQKGGAAALALAPDSPPIRPWTRTHLATLADVDALAQPNAKLPIGVPEVEGLGAALGWRLTRLARQEGLTLRSVELVTAEVSAEDVTREAQVASLRVAEVGARAEVASAERRLEADTNMFEARRRNGASWKVVLKAMETQKEAAASLEAKKQALTQATQAYEAAAKAAEHAYTVTAPSAAPERALARVSLDQQGTALTLDLPVALALRDVTVPSLDHGSFEATRSAGLWDEVKTLDAAGAIAAVQGHFNWHNRSVELGGIKVPGALALHLLPCILPLLLLMVSRRVQGVGKSYSPFSTKVPETMPRVGFRSRVFDFIVVVLLPCLTAISAAASLFLIGQPALLPLGMAFLCVIFGVSAFGKLGELQNLLESVVHSHSYPPPQRS
ncbi:MAG TPA: hypothetical protein VFZ61_17755 [Polyangiales bacterium]